MTVFLKGETAGRGGQLSLRAAQAAHIAEYKMCTHLKYLFFNDTVTKCTQNIYYNYIDTKYYSSNASLNRKMQERKKGRFRY